VLADACLGVPGRPQSATGQSTLLSGENAPAAIGQHLLGFPNARLRSWLEPRSVFRALAEEGRDAFSELQVPAAALQLRQGFGRLIRSRSDRGIVAVLDPRLTTRGYGRAFLASLPPSPLFRSIDEARRWWGAAPG